MASLVLLYTFIIYSGENKEPGDKICFEAVTFLKQHCILKNRIKL